MEGELDEKVDEEVDGKVVLLARNVRQKRGIDVAEEASDHVGVAVAEPFRALGGMGSGEVAVNSEVLEVEGSGSEELCPCR